MLQDFGVISKDRTRLAPTTRHELVHALQEFLLSLVPLKGHAVLVIDEAQHLQPDAVEQLRLVSNVHDDAGTLLQIVLVGQPSLEAVLARPELRQVKQRVSRHVRLEPLGIAELSQYIDHRLAVAREGGTASHAVTFASEAFVGALAVVGRDAADPEPALRSRARGRVRTTGAFGRRVARRGGSGGTGHSRCFVDGCRSRAPPLDRSRARRSRTDRTLGGRSVRGGAHRLSGDRSAPTGEERRPRCRRRRRHRRGGGLVHRAGRLSLESDREHLPSRGASAGGAATADGTAVRGRARACSRSRSGFGSSSPAPQPAAPPPSTSALIEPAQAAAEPGSFEIVVVSFRTMTRASQVAAELTALGQPVRQRSSDGWQQVLAGPFATRTAAEEAQAKLDSSGYTGTQIRSRRALNPLQVCSIASRSVINP